MTISDIIKDLQHNKEVFLVLLKDIPKEEYLFKADEKTWSILELVSHLLDEEVEDFRARVKHVVENPETLPPPINPAAWVQERNYQGNDYIKTLDALLYEREKSITWLQLVDEALFDNFYIHPKVGKITAKHFLINWLAHDRMHMSQLHKLRLKYLSNAWNDNLNYAGGI